MQLQRAIYNRRSCRSFKAKKPDWRDILDVLDTTRAAPMAGGYFTLNFLIVNDEEKIKEIAEWAEQPFIAEAKYLVAFISDPSIIKNIYGDRAEMYATQQAGAAIQNFMLALTEKKLSTCWVGHFNDEKVKKVLEIPGSKKLEAIFPIGYEKIKPITRKVQADLYNRVNWNRWGNKRMNAPRTVDVPYEDKHSKY